MGNNQRILIVDDQAEMRSMLEVLLSNEGYDMYFAENGQAGLVQVEKVLPDVILLDIMMPGMNGFELCQLLKANPQRQNIPVILVTAFASKEDIARGFEAGADDFIAKPFDNLEIVARVRSMMRIKNQYDRLEQQRQELEDTLKLREELARMTTQRLGELERLHTIGLKLMNSLDSTYMVESVARTALELIPKAEHCVIRFLSDEDQLLPPTIFPLEKSRAMIGQGLGNKDNIAKAIDSKEVVYISGLQLDPTTKPLDADRKCTVVISPLAVDDRVIGILGIDSLELDAFELADRRILSILANQLATAVMKARLFESLSLELS